MKRHSVKALVVVLGVVVSAFVWSLSVCSEAYGTEALGVVEDREDDNAVEMALNGSVLEVHKHFLSGDEIPSFEMRIIYEGRTYELVEIHEVALDSSYVRPSQFFSRQVTKDIPPEDITSLSEYFSETLSLLEGEYEGELALISYDSQAVFEKWTGQVDKTYLFENLPDNDAVQIPTSYDFTIRSSEFFGAEQQKTLDLIGMDFAISTYNDLGRPIAWVAVANYRGEEDWLEIHHYQVSATYEGEVQSSVEGMGISATYEEVAEGAALITITEPEVAQSAPEVSSLSVPLIATTASFSLALGAVLLWFLLLRTNARLMQAQNKTDTKGRIICRRHVKLSEGEALFIVSDRIELFSQGRYWIELKPSIANRFGELVIAWRGCEVMRGDLAPTIEVGNEYILKASAALVALSEVGYV
jgi:hypothetical protein